MLGNPDGLTSLVTAARASSLTPRDVARWDLCESIASALTNAEAFMREVEAHHATLVSGPHTEAQRYASLSDVLLSHRVLGLLRPASEALPKPPPECGACGDVDRAHCSVCGEEWIARL